MGKITSLLFPSNEQEVNCCGIASLILFWGHLKILLVTLRKKKIVNCAIKQSGKGSHKVM